MYFDRRATMSDAKRRRSAGMDRGSSPHRENWAAQLYPQAAQSVVAMGAGRSGAGRSPTRRRRAASAPSVTGDTADGSRLSPASRISASAWPAERSTSATAVAPSPQTATGCLPLSVACRTASAGGSGSSAARSFIRKPVRRRPEAAASTKWRRCSSSRSRRPASFEGRESHSGSTARLVTSTHRTRRPAASAAASYCWTTGDPVSAPKTERRPREPEASVPNRNRPSSLWSSEPELVVKPRTNSVRSLRTAREPAIAERAAWAARSGNAMTASPNRLPGEARIRRAAWTARAASTDEARFGSVGEGVSRSAGRRHRTQRPSLVRRRR